MPAAKPFAPEVPLTRRESDVLDELLQGQSNRQIGRNLFISEDTVKSHVKAILRKLGARDRAHAVSLVLSSRTSSGGGCSCGCPRGRPGRGRRGLTQDLPAPPARTLAAAPQSPPQRRRTGRFASSAIRPGARGRSPTAPGHEPAPARGPARGASVPGRTPVRPVPS